MITLRQRFDLHRDLGQWSAREYASMLGYAPNTCEQFISYLLGRRNLTSAEATAILSGHTFFGRGNELPEEIIAGLELLAKQG